MTYWTDIAEYFASYLARANDTHTNFTRTYAGSILFAFVLNIVAVIFAIRYDFQTTYAIESRNSGDLHYAWWFAFAWSSIPNLIVLVSASILSHIYIFRLNRMECYNAAGELVENKKAKFHRNIAWMFTILLIFGLGVSLHTSYNADQIALEKGGKVSREIENIKELKSTKNFTSSNQQVALLDAVFVKDTSALRISFENKYKSHAPKTYAKLQNHIKQMKTHQYLLKKGSKLERIEAPKSITHLKKKIPGLEKAFYNYTADLRAIYADSLDAITNRYQKNTSILTTSMTNNNLSHKKDYKARVKDHETTVATSGKMHQMRSFLMILLTLPLSLLVNYFTRGSRLDKEPEVIDMDNVEVGNLLNPFKKTKETTNGASTSGTSGASNVPNQSTSSTSTSSSSATPNPQQAIPNPTIPKPTPATAAQPKPYTPSPTIPIQPKQEAVEEIVYANSSSTQTMPTATKEIEFIPTTADNTATEVHFDIQKPSTPRTSTVPAPSEVPLAPIEVSPVASEAPQPKNEVLPMKSVTPLPSIEKELTIEDGKEMLAAINAFFQMKNITKDEFKRTMAHYSAAFRELSIVKRKSVRVEVRMAETDPSIRYTTQDGKLKFWNIQNVKQNLKTNQRMLDKKEKEYAALQSGGGELTDVDYKQVIDPIINNRWWIAFRLMSIAMMYEEEGIIDHRNTFEK